MKFLYDQTYNPYFLTQAELRALALYSVLLLLLLLLLFFPALRALSKLIHIFSLKLAKQLYFPETVEILHIVILTVLFFRKALPSTPERGLAMAVGETESEHYFVILFHITAALSTMGLDRTKIRSTNPKHAQNGNNDRNEPDKDRSEAKLLHPIPIQNRYHILLVVHIPLERNKNTSMQKLIQVAPSSLQIS